MSGYPRRQVLDGNYNILKNFYPTLFVPEDYGWISWAYDPLKAAAGVAPVAAGYNSLTLLPIRKRALITNVIMDVVIAGSGLTSGECFAGLFDSAGNILSPTPDQSTAWASTGLKVMALTTAQPVQPGLYYSGIFYNGTTAPHFSYDVSSNAANGANSGPYPRFATDATHTGLTTAFYSPAALAASTYSFWSALS